MTDPKSKSVLAYGSSYEISESDTGDPYVHIPEFFVNPFYQGCGYGRKMLEHLIEKSSKKFPNSEWIDLCTQPYNHKAISLYKKNGFKLMHIIKKSDSLAYLGPDGKTYDVLKMAKPLHDNFAMHIYPCFNPSADKNPGIPEYFTEASAYPVERYAKYTKELYGEMIRFHYGRWEDDPRLTKKEVNYRAKNDASTLLSAQDRDPDFWVYCAITSVSIAGYIIVSKTKEGEWRLILDHYYDTEKNVLQKLVKEGLKRIKSDLDPEMVFKEMIEKDSLIGKSKTKYRSEYIVQDIEDVKEPEIEEVPPEEEEVEKELTVVPNSEPEEPDFESGVEIPQKKIPDHRIKQPTIAKPEIIPEKEKEYERTEVPYSEPIEPVRPMPKSVSNIQKKSPLSKPIKDKISTGQDFERSDIAKPDIDKHTQGIPDIEREKFPEKDGIDNLDIPAEELPEDDKLSDEQTEEPEQLIQPEKEDIHTQANNIKGIAALVTIQPTNQEIAGESSETVPVIDDEELKDVSDPGIIPEEEE